MDESKQSYPSVRAYQKNLLDLKYSVDLMRDYNFRFHKDYGTGLGITEAARGLQRTAQWMTGDTTDDGKASVLHYNRRDVRQTYVLEQTRTHTRGFEQEVGT